MKFKSKIDWWVYTVVAIFSVCTIKVCVSYLFHIQYVKSLMLPLLLFLCEFLIILPILFSTYYILEEDALFIRCGHFFFKHIWYSDIIKIRETKSLIAACGLSVNRVEVTYKYEDSLDVVQISPKEADRFIQEVTKKVKKNK